ncbi:MAG: tetraacyldisaccharide 4'-kinase, partial [Alphaproteobacteria bacterium]|nr:tetraacyldisaccharide 4'-kinase [Alphaproteobacteria bacterium]
MRTPDFWFGESPLAALLAPAGCLYAAGGRLKRSLQNPFSAQIPVICVGNLVAGGAGKTPVVQSLVRHLQSIGRKPHILLRGYGGREIGPLQVNPARHGFQDVGDEALLHSAIAPTWVSQDRAKGASAAIAKGADILVMDDGFQNAGLHQDLPLIVIDGAVGFGNKRVIPAGPLREPIKDGLARAKAVVLIGLDKTGVQAQLGLLPVFKTRIEAKAAPSLKDVRLVAFAGLGRPRKFFDTLRAMGADLIAEHAFADHHPYSPGDLNALLNESNGAKARLITTTKDHVRLPPGWADKVETLPVALVWEYPDAPAILSEIAF